MLSGRPIPLREERKLATTSITNELAEAFNQSIALPVTGQAEFGQYRTVLVLARISGVHKGRAGMYDAKSIVELEPYNPDKTGDVKEDDIGKVSKDADLVAVSPVQAFGGAGLAEGDIVLAHVIGETNKGVAYAYIVPGAGGGAESFVARVTGNTRDGSNWRWTYSFVEVIKTSSGYGGWTDKPNGRSGNTLRNLIEDQNGASGLLGNGVNTSNLVGTFEPKPIPTGTRVRVWEEKVGDETEYWCQYENGIDGECP